LAAWPSERPTLDLCNDVAPNLQADAVATVDAALAAALQGHSKAVR